MERLADEVAQAKPRAGRGFQIVRFKPEGTCVEATPFAWAALTVAADVLIAWATGRKPSWKWSLAKAAGVYAFRVWMEKRDANLDKKPAPKA